MKKKVFVAAIISAVFLLTANHSMAQNSDVKDKTVSTSKSTSKGKKESKSEKGTAANRTPTGGSTTPKKPLNENKAEKNVGEKSVEGSKTVGSKTKKAVKKPIQ